MPEMLELLALHKHWLAADAVKQFLFVPVPARKKATFPKDLEALGQFWSTILRLEVFYGLIYVVVEGYQKLGCHDRAVDELLAQTDYVNAFRRFRNAMFHYQGDPIPPKLLEFLAAQGSEDWTHKLFGAFRAFFEANLPIKEYIARFSEENA
jgi:hypothetical protein